MKRRILSLLLLVPGISLSLTAQTPLDKTFEAHGGLDTWKSYQGLSFDIEYPGKNGARTEHFQIDLNTRHERIQGSDYELGYDGENYWQWNKGEEKKNRNPKFMVNLQFYFFAFPFVMADPGVNLEALGKRTVGGKSYDVVKATFNSGVGVAPKDQYLLHLNPETHQLELLLYSVTYFNAENAENYNAVSYSDWQEVDGLMVPQQMSSYKWDKDNMKLGEKRSAKKIINVKFDSSKPDQAIFSMPAAAEAKN